LTHEPVSQIPHIEASDLSVVLAGQQILDIPSLQIMPNEVVCIIGPNGSGKTTLLLALASLLKPAGGTVTYNGQSLTGRSDILKLHRKIGMVFQDPLLLSTSVWDNITLGLKLRKFKKEEIKSRIEKWLERFGIAQLARRQAKTLSGGEAKRASLARAFALQPEIIFLDEPFNGLDSPTRIGLIEDFESVLRETKVTTLMVTHDSDEALELANRIIVLVKGRIRQIGSPSEVFSHPADEEVANFVKAGNILAGEVISQSDGLASVGINDRQIEAVSNLEPRKEVTVFLRYEDVTISPPLSGRQISSSRNYFIGTLIKSFIVGSQVRVSLDCGFPLTALVTRRSWGELRLQTGDKVAASFKASSIHLIPKH
jgi:tungstate transport system ATP-binding protein